MFPSSSTVSPLFGLYLPTICTGPIVQQNETLDPIRKDPLSLGYDNSGFRPLRRYERRFRNYLSYAPSIHVIPSSKRWSHLGRRVGRCHSVLKRRRRLGHILEGPCTGAFGEGIERDVGALVLERLSTGKGARGTLSSDQACEHTKKTLPGPITDQFQPSFIIPAPSFLEAANFHSQIFLR